jgi:DNA polymerase-3 subunit epsilon
MKYAIIDIETTGLSPKNEKITEIAIFIHNGKEIVDEFTTLINPEKKIPYRIVQITGINNPMVADAPKFYEVAKKIVEITEGAIFVGHNVRFDYGFVRQEFLSLGYDYQRNTLDTVKLSRKLIPGQPSYSLGKLCKSLGIDNHARHRAAGDAMATVALFELLLSIDGNLSPETSKKAGKEVNQSLTDGLPHEAGVYYFYDHRDELIYVGKSVDIHNRVLSHLNNHLHEREQRMKNQLSRIDFTVTGSELVALLLESSEIKKHQPVYNRAQRRTFYNYGLYSFSDEQGYTRLKLSKLIDDLNPIYTYNSLQEGKEHLYKLCEQFTLCQKLTGLYESSGSCFHYQIHQCNGACIGKEAPMAYNARVQQALENYHFEQQNFFLVDRGRNENEKAVVQVKNGRYLGFGFVPLDYFDGGDTSLEDFIQPQVDNKEVRRIILSQMKRSKGRLVIINGKF